MAAEKEQLSRQVERLQATNHELEHQRNRAEISELIESKFSERIAAGLNAQELEAQMVQLRGELNRILEERDQELLRLEQKERELAALRNEYGELEVELASVVATKEAQIQDKKNLKNDLKARIDELEEQIRAGSELTLPVRLDKGAVEVLKLNGKEFEGLEEFV